LKKAAGNANQGNSHFAGDVYSPHFFDQKRRGEQVSIFPAT
jgi:hypothetical protein